MARAFDGDGRPSVGMVAAWLVLLTLPDLAAAQRGEEIFASSCVACHTVGGGRLVGPDLEGVTERRSEEWLIRFIRSSQAVIASGDEDAVALSEAYPGLLMPDWALSDDEIRDVLTYIRTGADAGPQGPELPDEFTAAQVEHGRHLFQGTARLEGGGPPCNSCHHVVHDAVIGGGVLAVELTSVFSRLGGAGVRAIVGSPPFPVMERAYRNQPLTEEEQLAILAFLQRADADQAFQEPRDYGVRLLQAGIVGTLALFGFYSLLWRKRRRRPLQAAVFDRQVRSH